MSLSAAAGGALSIFMTIVILSSSLAQGAENLLCSKIFVSQHSAAQLEKHTSGTSATLSREAIQRLNDPNLQPDDPAIAEFESFLRARAIQKVSELYPAVDLSRMGMPWSKYSKPPFDFLLKQAGGVSKFIEIFDQVLQVSDRTDHPLEPSVLFHHTVMAIRFGILPKPVKAASARTDVIDSTQIKGIRSLEEGGFSRADVVEFEGKLAVYLQPKIFHAEPQINRNIGAIGQLTPEESQALLRLNPTTFADIRLQGDDFDLRILGLESGVARDPEKLNRLKLFRSVVIGLADMVNNFDHLGDLQKIQYRGRSIAPKPYKLVRTSDGMIRGFLMEYLPFPTLYELVKSKRLSREQAQDVVNDVREQLELLHRNKLTHGDIRLTNILVELNPEGRAIAHLIDWVSSKSSLPKSNMPDNESRTFEELKEFLRQHFVLQAFFESRPR